MHLVRLEQDALTVNGPNVLAFEPGISLDIRRVEGALMFAGGLFNTVLSGSGWAATTAVVLRTDAPNLRGRAVGGGLERQPAVERAPHRQARRHDRARQRRGGADRLRPARAS